MTFLAYPSFTFVHASILTSSSTSTSTYLTCPSTPTFLWSGRPGYFTHPHPPIVTIHDKKRDNTNIIHNGDRKEYAIERDRNQYISHTISMSSLQELFEQKRNNKGQFHNENDSPLEVTVTLVAKNKDSLLSSSVQKKEGYNNNALSTSRALRSIIMEAPSSRVVSCLTDSNTSPMSNSFPEFSLTIDNIFHFLEEHAHIFTNQEMEHLIVDLSPLQEEDGRSIESFDELLQALNQKLHEATEGSYAMMHMTINDNDEANNKRDVILTSTLKSEYLNAPSTDFERVDPFPNEYTFAKKRNPNHKMARRRLAHQSGNDDTNVSEYTNPNIIAGFFFMLLFLYTLYVGIGAMHACSTSMYLLHAPIPEGKEY